MSRTEELRRGGAKERGGGGGGTPFVKWSEGYGWIEGHVKQIWEGKFGESATMVVTACSAGLEVAGKSEEGEKYVRAIQKGEEVNVGMNYAALKNAITADDAGKHFHVAFEGWGESKAGDKFRMFAVLEVPTENGKAKPGVNVPRAAPPPADDLPF